MTWLDLDEITDRLETVCRVLEHTETCDPATTQDLLYVTMTCLRSVSRDLHDLALDLKGETHLTTI